MIQFISEWRSFENALFCSQAELSVCPTSKYIWG